MFPKNAPFLFIDIVKMVRQIGGSKQGSVNLKNKKEN